MKFFRFLFNIFSLLMFAPAHSPQPGRAKSSSFGTRRFSCFSFSLANSSNTASFANASFTNALCSSDFVKSKSELSTSILSTFKAFDSTNRKLSFFILPRLSDSIFVSSTLGAWASSVLCPSSAASLPCDSASGSIGMSIMCSCSASLSRSLSCVALFFCSATS